MLLLSGPMQAQRSCESPGYANLLLERSVAGRGEMEAAENFIRQHLADRSASRGPETIITIPVVVHIIYHDALQNFPDQLVIDQVRVLNECFRRLNADTGNTPTRFRSRASDPGIEFKLAISDPNRRATTGIIRHYTPVTAWAMDDKVKYSNQTGDDAWNTRQYLNIWVCNLGRTAGYATFPGADAAIDGVVLNFSAFGLRTGTIYDGGKTAVHEVGHWLGLKHIWGDEYCGDDLVDDTPVQSNFTMSCPASGFAAACDNDPAGTMFMNYMDLSIDACTNIFTEGQAARMRSVFASGGPRSLLPVSIGLLQPLFSEIPVADDQPKWSYANLYPNPAHNSINIDFSNDVRWVGKTISITNAQGQLITRMSIDAKLIQVDISRLKPGYYFVTGKKEDGATVQLRFVKI